MTLPPSHTSTQAKLFLILTLQGSRRVGVGWEWKETGLEKGGPLARLVFVILHTGAQTWNHLFSPSLPFEKCLSYTEWAIN